MAHFCREKKLSSEFIEYLDKQGPSSLSQENKFITIAKAKKLSTILYDCYTGSWKSNRIAFKWMQALL